MTEALARFQESSFDVVVSDIEMPGGSGIDLLRRLKQLNARVPVILMSGNVLYFTRNESWKALADAMLEKPFTEETLIATLERVCGVKKPGA